MLQERRDLCRRGWSLPLLIEVGCSSVHEGDAPALLLREWVQGPYIVRDPIADMEGNPGSWRSPPGGIILVQASDKTHRSLTNKVIPLFDTRRQDSPPAAGVVRRHPPPVAEPRPGTAIRQPSMTSLLHRASSLVQFLPRLRVGLHQGCLHGILIGPLGGYAVSDLEEHLIGNLRVVVL